MKVLEKFNAIFLGAGIGLLVFAFITLGLVPALMTRAVTISDYMPTSVPYQLEEHFETLDEYQAAIYRGRKIYIKEACWHCHSQYVRPVGNEALRYGPVSTVEEYENTLHLPQLFGTRRVGPDLIRQYNKHSVDWQLTHLYNPRDVVPESVMPGYPWYFNDDRTPKPAAMDLVAYLMELGRWMDPEAP